MAGIAIPHKNVPTVEFGNYHLKNVTQLFNENFNSLVSQIQAIYDSVTSLGTSKADSDHNHDGVYADSEHTHNYDEITGLESQLANKADSEHEHSQYQTIESATSLFNQLVQYCDTSVQTRAELSHTHGIDDVTGLNGVLSQYATTEYVGQNINFLYSQMAVLNPQKGGEGSVNSSDVLFDWNDTTDTVGTSKKAARADHKHKLVYDNSESEDDVFLGVESWSKKVEAYTHLNASHVGTFIGTEGGVEQTLADFIDGVDSQNSGGLVTVGVDGGHPVLSSVKIDGADGDVIVANGSSGIKSTETISVSKVNFGTGVTNVTSSNIGDYAVQSVNGQAGVVTVEEFPGFGTTSGTAAEGNHIHSQYVEEGDLGDAAFADIGVSDGVQEYSSKLSSLDSALDDSGKVPLSQLTGNIEGHSGDCYVTIDTNGVLGHSGNGAYNLLNDASDSTKGANKLITDKDVGDGLQANSVSHNLEVKCDPNGCVVCDSTNGLDVGNLTANKFVKTDADGYLDVSEDDPITVANQTGVVYATAGEASPTITTKDILDVTETATTLKESALPKKFDDQKVLTDMIEALPGTLSETYKLIFYAPKFDKYGRYIGLNSTATVIADNIIYAVT